MTLELRKPVWLYLKAGLFLLVLIGSSILVVFDERPVIECVGLVLVIWSSARLYYFLFYVLEKYVDPSYRYTGLCSLARYLYTKARGPR